MGTFAYFSEAEAYFKGDRFAALNGIELTGLTDTSSTAVMTVTDNHRNAIGGIMGGAIFTLCDLAFAALVNNIHSPTVALDCDIKFLSASKGQKLTAKAELIKAGRSTIIVRVMVFDEFEKEVALFTGTGFKL